MGLSDNESNAKLSLLPPFTDLDILADAKEKTAYRSLHKEEDGYQEALEFLHDFTAISPSVNENRDARSIDHPCLSITDDTTALLPLQIGSTTTTSLMEAAAEVAAAAVEPLTSLDDEHCPTVNNDSGYGSVCSYSFS